MFCSIFPGSIFGYKKMRLNATVIQKSTTHIKEMLKASTIKIPVITRDTVLPIKIDITHKGARFVDSFSWKLNDTLIDPDQFAATTCSDLSLPFSFRPKISAQIIEQIKSYKEIMSVLYLVSYDDNFANSINLTELQTYVLGIRYNNIECNLFWFDIIKSRSFYLYH